MWQAVQKSGTANVSIVEGTDIAANLPPESCDAVFMRRVYHHFTKPAEMDASLLKSLRPGGRLLVIDHEPIPMKELADVLPSRGGDGVTPAVLVKELTETGFVHVKTVKPWEDRLYLAVFREP